MSSTIEQNLTALSQLVSLVSKTPEEFLRPSAEVQQTAIQAAKFLLDPLATNVANVQTERRSESRRKRKRGDDEEEESVLQLKQVYTKGFGVKQVWEQAKRILDAAQHEVERDIRLHQDVTRTDINGAVTPKNESQEEQSTAELENEDLEEDDVNTSDEGVDEEDLDDYEGIEDEETDEEEDIEAESEVDDSDDNHKSKKSSTYIQDPNGLNDGFFSIDDFNQQSQFLEQMDARGDDDNPSDEDEIDWDADPLAQPLTAAKSTRSRNDADEDDESEDDETGPTFGNADLGASMSEDDEVLDEVEDQDLDGEIGGLSNANEINYADFFEPPPSKPSKNKRMRALPKTQPPPKPQATSEEDAEAEEERLQDDLERAMADVRRDLLDSDEEDLSDDDDGGDEDESDDDLGPKKAKSKSNDKNMSTHEKQRAAIAAEIRQLEAANVAKRDWQLSGEARAADRPVNSLIEEDLEFERAGKPIAPVTAETTEEIDALIKRRILAREFDEVVRRVPGSLNLASDTRRGRIEVDDTKPQASLGEIYEAEHQKNADPLSYIDKRSAAVKKQHAEIDLLWKQVRDQLDILSNMHFKPKRVDVEIKTVEDKPRIAMEDARPVGEIESGEGGMLAPQEVYQPGLSVKRSNGEIMLNGGAAVSKEEMSREEKLRRRRRDKERAKKAQNNKEVQVLGKTQPSKQSRKKEKEAEKSNIINDLKRGGVKVVGKGGELQNIGEQKKGKRDAIEVTSSALKL